MVQGAQGAIRKLVREPMIAVIERLAVDFRAFAPDLWPARRSRCIGSTGTRASRTTRRRSRPNRRGLSLPRPRQASRRGLLPEVAPTWVWIGGGMYAPDTSQLQRARAHRREPSPLPRHRRIAAFRRQVGPLGGERLQRVPRGFPRDHAAAEYLKHRQFLAGREFPAAFASSPSSTPACWRCSGRWRR